MTQYPALMSVLKGIALVLGISALYQGLFFIAGALTGAGHGCYFFVEALGAPFLGIGMVAMVFWPLVAVLLALRHFFFCRFAAAVALVAHYVGVLAVMSWPGWNDKLDKSWEYFPSMVAAFLIGYCGSQLFMWFLIARPRARSNKPLWPYNSWEQARTAGHGRFILFHGIVFWGIPFGAVAACGPALYDMLMDSPIPSLPTVAFSFGLLSVVFGYGMGESMWRKGEKTYRATGASPGPRSL